ncbi:amidohydrolase 2 [Setomelanomma holmii]|uniref:Amidohydrolase 2 n=1 Tax=Setomelanomma holmii TaxID=210430 RepID=A0A9P4H7N5_9PLEO|nr:amidohydrolase 2 [Setomelanomma holmii]
MARFMLILLFVITSRGHSTFDRDSISAAAEADGIDLNILPFAADALDSIEALYTPVAVPQTLQNATRIDVHSHVVPPWYRTLVSLTGGSPTPNWTIESHFSLMATLNIRRSIVSISTPGTIVFAGDAPRSIALARLLNEYLAALARAYPEHFSFYATAPLPYVNASIKEVNYAVNKLNALAIGLLSNYEGIYLGNPVLIPFFDHIDNRNSNTTSILFVHPNAPCLHLTNGTLIDANPTLYPEGTVEFYFETARTFMDLSLSRTFVNFTNLNWIVPHAGGSFPSIMSRFLTTASEALRNADLDIYRRRLWWDTAGPTFPFQIQGLLGYGVPLERIVYGTDYPYIPVPNNAAYIASTQAIVNATFMTGEEREGIFSGNAKGLFGLA